MDKLNLNIVSLDVPYPPDYGGVIDIFYKIKALHARGVQIYLHCFEYGRGHQEALMPYCKEVHYYRRKTGIFSQFSRLPYIINSRRDKKLLENLNSNSYPILFEGLHSAYYLIKGYFKDRTVLLRSHNLEHDYYQALASRESNVLKKIFYNQEASKLRSILNELPEDLSIGAISMADTDYLKQNFKHTFWLPPFHSNDSVTSLEGKGNYALYHGNLKVSENIEAAMELINEFNGKAIRLIIAGNSPPPKMKSLIKGCPNIELADELSVQDMHDLIKNAQVILLPTHQSTGIKLKLIESLCKGRFCLANDTMVKGTGLEACVEIAENNFYVKTAELMDQNFTQNLIEQRKAVIKNNFDNFRNADLLIEKFKTV